jgi:hypothetical protein
VATRKAGPVGRADVLDGLRRVVDQAVAGRGQIMLLVAQAAGERPGAVTEALAAAVRARVVSQDGTDSYRFAHDLFREYAYDQLPAAERASLHQRIGEALEASRAAGGDVPLTELARHFVHADPASPPSWEYSVAAAGEATARLAYEDAVRQGRARPARHRLPPLVAPGRGHRAALRGL